MAKDLMKRKIYIAGGGGMLGEAFYKQFSAGFELKVTDIDVNETWISYLDFRDAGAYEKDVKEFKPDYLFHLGAHTDLEYCEKNIEDAYLTNTTAVEYAVRISNELNIPLLFIGTAGVFDGRKQLYDETDIPNPMGHYARSKWLAEKYVQEHAKHYLICRAGWMMGGGPQKDKKFVGKLLRQIERGATQLNIVRDRFGTPTYTHDFARNVKLLLEKNCTGLYNMACNGETDRIEIAQEITRLLGREKDVAINEVSSDFFKAEYFAPRPASEQLLNTRLCKEGNNVMRNWVVCLKEYIETAYSHSISVTPAKAATVGKEVDISVVICTYNRGRFINKAVESVLKQTYPSVEVIVIDDGSTDNTRELLKKYERFSNFQYKYQENKGRSMARNEGLALARGAWIMFLDSDDYLRDNALKVLYDLALESKNSGIVYANFSFVTENKLAYLHHGQINGKEHDRDLFFELLEGTLWLTKTGTYLIKKELAKEVGGFSTEFEPSEDFDYAFKILLKTKASYISDNVLCVERHDGNTDEAIMQEAIIKLCKHYQVNKTEGYRQLTPREIRRLRYGLNSRIANGSYELDKHNQAFRHYMGMLRLRPSSIVDPFFFKQIFASLVHSSVKKVIRHNRKIKTK